MVLKNHLLLLGSDCHCFSNSTQVTNSFPPNITALYETGKLKVQTKSLQAGSIIVRLRVAVQDPEFPVDASTFAPMLSYLYNGSVLLVDQQNSAIEGNLNFIYLFIFDNRRVLVF